jgi:galactose mutarotase-like enzyme
VFLTKELFDNDALVFENSQINKLSLCSSRSNHKITIDCQSWPFFGIWAKKGNTDFVCLEPWYGIADRLDSTNVLTEKNGIIELAPNTDYKCHFSLVFN